MTFASALDSYCKITGRTNRQISDYCDVSPSTLTRYRHGERVPEPGSTIVRKLAEALAELSAEENPLYALDADEVNTVFENELASPQMAGMDFHMRLDMLMHLIGIRNADFAEVTGVDPSYISRIRRGQRMPANMREFASICSHLAANMCIARNLVDDVGELVGMPEISRQFPPEEEDSESEIAEVIEVWLTGSEIYTTDIVEMNKLFKWLDKTDFSEWIALGDSVTEAVPEAQLPVARFYHGLGGMRSAEREFVSTAIKAHAKNAFISSDMPLLSLAGSREVLDSFMDSGLELIRNGCHINILYSLERPLEDTIKSLRLWIPLYITGCVTPGFLKGVNNRLFYHVNRICDVCVLSAESVMGHEADGRCYFSTRPEDIAYYQKKMDFILEKSSTLIEIYREHDPAQKKSFHEAEAARKAKGNGKRIGANRYKNLTVTSYPGDCVVLSVPCGSEPVHLVSRHPKINYIVARMN